jgi:hypothetical protein
MGGGKRGSLQDSLKKRKTLRLQARLKLCDAAPLNKRVTKESINAVTSTVCCNPDF